VAATPLQEKLNNLAELIAKVGGACGLILFIALMIKFFIQLKTDPDRFDLVLLGREGTDRLLS
jgi:P-type Ca2+ transporter type 2C